MNIKDVAWNPDEDPRRKDADTAEFLAALNAGFEGVTQPVTVANGISIKTTWLDEVPIFDASLIQAPMEETMMSGVWVKHHTKDACKGRNCVIHNPSKHLMARWERRFRPDKQTTERVCAHGIGHPDPDDVAYWRSEGRSEKSLTTHGCDGCCTAKAPVPKL